MFHYWKINKKSFYGYLIVGLLVFLISLFHVKNSAQPLMAQLTFNILVSFGIPLSLYLILFLLAFSQYRKLSLIFSQFPFNDLPATVYTLQETKPTYVSLAGLTIRGTSNGYPVRIEYEKGMAIIVVGIQAEDKPVNSVLDAQGVTLHDLGVIKQLKISDLLRKRESFNLNDEIDKITGFLRRNNIHAYTTSTVNS